MKKALIFTIILLMASGITVKAQTERGKLFLAGSNRLDLTVGGEKQKVNGDDIEGSKKTNFNFNFQPKVGYTVINNLVAGLYMDVNSFSSISKESTGYSNKGTSFAIGPFARYFIPVSKKMLPFVEGQVGFGSGNTQYRSGSSGDWYKSKTSLFSYRLGGGATYFFNNVAGLDLFLGFNHYSKKHKSTVDESRSSDSTSKYIHNEFILIIGFIIMLGQ